VLSRRPAVVGGLLLVLMLLTGLGWAVASPGLLYLGQTGTGRWRSPDSLPFMDQTSEVDV